MMRTAGLTMNDVWADRVLREHGVEVHRLDGLHAEILVLVDQVELKHRGPTENFRPYLHLTGELRAVTPFDGLPCGIHQVTFSGGQGEKVDAFYEFDDQQMVALARKGYFNPAFSIPEDRLTGVEWELPATVDALVLMPGDAHDDRPVCFVRVHRIADLEIDLESSQYDLTDYFDDFSKDGVEHGERVVVEDQRILKARSDAINSVFAEDRLEPSAEGQRPGTSTPAEMPPRVKNEMTTGMQAIEAEIEAERARFAFAREHVEGTPEKLYRDRVAEPVADADPTAPPHAERALFGDDLAPVESTGAGPATPERQGVAARRAADLDFGDDDHEEAGLGS